MNSKRRWLFLLLFLLTVGAFDFWRAYPGLRQQSLDHRLLAAVQRDDTSAAVSLLDQGANPNASFRTASLSFWQALKCRLQGRQPELSTTTALEAAFDVKIALAAPAFEAEDTPDIEMLTQLLTHGASLHPEAHNGIKICAGHLTNAPQSPCAYIVRGADNPDGTGAIVVGTEAQTEALVNAALKAGARRF